MLHFIIINKILLLLFIFISYKNKIYIIKISIHIFEKTNKNYKKIICKNSLQQNMKVKIQNTYINVFLHFGLILAKVLLLIWTLMNLNITYEIQSLSISICTLASQLFGLFIVYLWPDNYY